MNWNSVGCSKLHDATVKPKSNNYEMCNVFIELKWPRYEISLRCIKNGVKKST